MKALQAPSLPLIPEAHHAVVGRAAGNHVVPVAPYAVQGAVMGLFPLPDTFPGAGPYVPVADVGVIPTRKEKGGRFIEDVKDSGSTVKVSP